MTGTAASACAIVYAAAHPDPGGRHADEDTYRGCGPGYLEERPVRRLPQRDPAGRPASVRFVIETCELNRNGPWHLPEAGHRAAAPAALPAVPRLPNTGRPHASFRRPRVPPQPSLSQQLPACLSIFKSLPAPFQFQYAKKLLLPYLACVRLYSCANLPLLPLPAAVPLLPPKCFRNSPPSP